MSYVLWERREPVEKGSIGTPEQAKRIIEGLEARARELHPERTLAQALEAFFAATVAGGPERKRNYQAALAFLAAAAAEGKTMKMKLELPSADVLAKLFTGAGEPAYLEYAARQAGDRRADITGIYDVFVKALAPVVELLKRQDRLAEAAAVNAAFRVTPSAYVELRQSQNARDAGHEPHEAIAKRATRVAGIAKALAGMVEKDASEGTAEERLLRTAARFDWED